MARAALGWGVRDLAASAKVSPDTIARLERGENLYPRTVEAIRAALEAAGVEFIAENGGGPGVRLRKPGSAARAEDPEHPTLRSVGPEDEDRAGPEAPDTTDLATDGK
jgi:transcriptional regulator with XRE-family HTH domain